MRYYKSLIEKRILKTIIYIFLVFAAFSDILRIPNTSLTLFRLSLPIIIGVVLMHQKYGKWLIGLTIGLLLLTIVQYIIFYSVDRTDLDFSSSIALKFFVLYVLAFVVFLLVGLLKDYTKQDFERQGFRFIVWLGLCLMFVTFLHYCDVKYFESHFFGALIPDNPNNYGCYIAALFPFLLINLKEKGRMRDKIAILAAFIIVYIRDSKAALFGMVLVGVVYLCISRPAENLKKLFLYRCVIIICAVVMIVGAIIINPKINGYSLQDTIAQPIIRILTDNPYPDYESSISYRTNTIIYCLKKLVQTGFIGIGVGNTGVALKRDFPDISPELELAKDSPFLSLHNSWLECALDLGIVVLIVYFILIKYAVKLYFTKGKLTNIEQLRVMFIISFPIWIMSTSGMYTLYYLMIVMAYLLFSNSNAKLEEDIC